MITALLALLCVGLAIACITLYSGRATLKDENERLTEERARAEVDAKNKADLLTQANDRANKMSAQLSQSVMISELPAAVRGSSKTETVRRIESVLSGGRPGAAATDTLATPTNGDAAAWLEKIAQMVSRQAIDTRSETRTETLKGVQIVLARVGSYGKPVNGNQRDTMEAVLAFQKANGLKADAIIGKGTWGKVREKFEVAVAGR